MEDIFVGRLMSTDVVTISPTTTVEAAAQVLLEENIGSVIVVDGENQPKGILTSTDFVRIVANGDPNDVTTVEDHMSEEIVSVEAQDSIQDAADRFITYQIHHLPVVDDDEGVVGILSTTDLTKYLKDVEKLAPT